MLEQVGHVLVHLVVEIVEVVVIHRVRIEMVVVVVVVDRGKKTRFSSSLFLTKIHLIRLAKEILIENFIST